MKRLLISGFSGVALVAVLAAPAAATVYQCEVSQSAGKQWVSAEYTIDHNAITNEIQVNDNLINGVYQAPLAVRKYHKTRKKLRVNWTVEGTAQQGAAQAQGSEYLLPILFEAVIRINSGRMKLRVYGPNGERINGRGRCSIH